MTLTGTWRALCTFICSFHAKKNVLILDHFHFSQRLRRIQFYISCTRSNNTVRKFDSLSNKIAICTINFKRFAWFVQLDVIAKWPFPWNNKLITIVSIELRRTVFICVFVFFYISFVSSVDFLYFGLSVFSSSKIRFRDFAFCIHLDWLLIYWQTNTNIQQIYLSILLWLSLSLSIYLLVRLTDCCKVRLIFFFSSVSVDVCFTFSFHLNFLERFCISFHLMQFCVCVYARAIFRRWTYALQFIFMYI